MYDRENGIFDNVLCVPRLRRNFLSIGQITREKKNVIIEFQENNYLIKDMARKFKFVDHDFEENGVYKLETSNCLQQNMHASIMSIRKLWHARFGYINHN